MLPPPRRGDELPMPLGQHAAAAALPGYCRWLGALLTLEIIDFERFRTRLAAISQSRAPMPPPLRRMRVSAEGADDFS